LVVQALFVLLAVVPLVLEGQATMPVVELANESENLVA